MTLISLLSIMVSISALSATPSLSEIAADFSAQGVGYMHQETANKKPLLIEKGTAAEMGWELYRHFIGEDEISDFKTFERTIWEEKANEAWDSDGSKFGAITYKDALDYVEGGSLINDSDKESAEFKRTVQIFKQLGKYKNLIYIVGPVGASPCGDVTLPAVLIIDTKSGEVFYLSMDSSFC